MEQYVMRWFVDLEFSNTQNYGREQAGQRLLLVGGGGGVVDGKGRNEISRNGECSAS